MTSAVKYRSSHQHNGHKSFFTGETFKGQKPQKALVTHFVNEMTKILQKAPQTPIGLTTETEDQFPKLHQNCQNKAFP